MGSKAVVRTAAEGVALALSVCSGLLLSVSGWLKTESGAGSAGARAGTAPGSRGPVTGTITVPPAAHKETGPNDPKELEAFLDRFFANEGMGEDLHHAAFVLVKEGKVFLEKGYGYTDGEKKSPFIPGSTSFFAASNSNVFPTTAAQMGRFVVGLLNAGLLGCGHAWDAARRGMYRQHFAQHPEAPDAIYGFLETFTHNQRAFFHTGGQEHRSLIYLLPDQNIGFYLVMGGVDEKTSFRIRGRLVQKFLDRYYPVKSSVTSYQ